MKSILAFYSLFILAFMLAKANVQPILSEKDVTDDQGRLTYLTYGMPMASDYQESKIAYHNYKLQFIGVAGCMVTEKLLDSIKHHNEFVDRIMDKRFGHNWYDTLSAQTKREYAYDSSLISLVTNIDYVRERQKKMRAKGNGLHFMVDSNIGAIIREISACGYADTSSNWVQYFLFKVNSRTRKLVYQDNKAIVIE